MRTAARPVEPALGDAAGDEIAITRADRDRAARDRADHRRDRRTRRETAPSTGTARPRTSEERRGRRHPTTDRRAPSTRPPRRVAEPDRGRRRWAADAIQHGVTESDEIDYRPPPAKLLERGKADPGPDTRDREAVAKALLEALRHFGVEARLLGIVSGPHVSRYELQLAPGTKVVEGRPAPGRPRLRAGLDRHPDPGADPRQEGGRGRGSEPAPTPGAPRRHLRRAPEGLLAAARPGSARTSPASRSATDLALMPHVAGRRHHRLGQVGLHQRDALLDPAARLAQRGPAGARRPEAGRAQPLRAAPAPADARGHQPAPGGERARQPDRRDGEPLRGHERGAGAQPGRAQPGAAARPASRRSRTSSA